MYPRLKIEINKNFDKDICSMFLSVKKAGIDFGNGIVNLHPELKKDKIGTYFDNFYKTHESELEITRNLFIKDWERIQDIFFKTCNKYFGEVTWPPGNYLALLSIINCNPRFLEQKKFQVYWKNEKGFVPIAVHEMLHFLFYNMLVTNFSKVDIKSNDVWKLSEVFNVLVLSEPNFIEITKDPKPDQYPDLINLQRKLAPIWIETHNTKLFLEKSLASL